MTDSTPLTLLSSALADVVARIAPSVVSVHSHRSRSTGFVWKPGLIVTADAAMAGRDTSTVIADLSSTVEVPVAERD